MFEKFLAVLIGIASLAATVTGLIPPMLGAMWMIIALLILILMQLYELNDKRTILDKISGQEGLRLFKRRKGGSEV